MNWLILRNLKVSYFIILKSTQKNGNSFNPKTYSQIRNENNANIINVVRHKGMIPITEWLISSCLLLQNDVERDSDPCRGVRPECARHLRHWSRPDPRLSPAQVDTQGSQHRLWGTQVLGLRQRHVVLGPLRF